MSVRIRCANGHALVAGRGLAGKRLACPRCGAPVEVPQRKKGDVAAQGALARLSAYGIDLAQPDQHSTPGATVPEPREEAVWHVAFGSEHQVGPVSPRTIRAWIDDGQIEGGTLVWRTPWTSWHTAASVFPEVEERLTTNAITAHDDHTGQACVEPRSASANIQQRPRSQSDLQQAIVTKRALSRADLRRQRRERALWATGILLLVAVGLATVLVAVVRRQEPKSAFRHHGGSRIIQQVARNAACRAANV